jgi:excisionase family DNA binding protein
MEESMNDQKEEPQSLHVWMTVEEVARYLRVSKSVVYNLTSNGYLPYYKIGGRNRFLRSEIDQIILNEKVGA